MTLLPVLHASVAHREGKTECGLDAAKVNTLAPIHWQHVSCKRCKAALAKVTAA